ncbi:Ger(x)C family spore germination protein [Paenibacillus sp. MSJ-34]|uniref:Ger(x)C family spore germination protein n=1 Tax=Paenibacillus sp. MSJ-34 TaxID=2841529 RepID=UPI001C114DF7|nr:Ger(x)C family spore germination protein [Paenibacillus sp. MSJ-34]MBU5444880.1 Ger(x)C family spore germination protein [Paenibacillus sp. MSJ-34]
MTKKLFAVFITCLALLALTGCKDQNLIENLTLSLVIGMDLNEQNEFEVSISSPVFNKEAKDKEEEFQVTSTTLRKSRDEFDKVVLGSTAGGKAELILVGKKLMRHPGWATILDALYRDPKNTVTPRLVMVDGPVYDIIRLSPKDKPRLPLYLMKVIDMAYVRNVTVRTTLQQFYRHHKEKGMTSAITEIGLKGRDIQILGTALLDDREKYKLTISSTETKLLNMMKQPGKGAFPLTLQLPEFKSSLRFLPTNQLSFNTFSVKTRKKARYDRGKFRFDVNIKMAIFLTERLFPIDMRKETRALERCIESELERQFADFIRKIQAAKIDPVGFGMYARAYAYPQWKKVEDDWGEEFADAEVNVKVDVEIQGMGAMK